ncbi:hypothetical protein GCM10023329_42070 [Streptomyces sanyensis]|uniref:Uncharacterized protein n=1 Tax=Streptomyces sanyensis TaxID=568869 RepID=A0ABP9AVB2_9ACTN
MLLGEPWWHDEDGLGAGECHRLHAAPTVAEGDGVLPEQLKHSPARPPSTACRAGLFVSRFQPDGADCAWDGPAERRSSWSTGSRPGSTVRQERQDWNPFG